MASERIGIIGAGTMGAGIAQVALEAGHEVRLHDADLRAVGRAQERIRDGLVRRARRLQVDPAAVDGWVASRLDRLRPALSVEDVATGSELVIEAVPEDLQLKTALFETLDRVAPAATILATNTSALSVASVAGEVRQPGRIVGLHFFNPAPVMALVEVVSGPATDPATADRGEAIVRSWGKTTVRCADAPGFIVNRVNRPFTLEALAMLQARAASIARIDGAVRAAGFPMGPFELMDLTGIDINLATTTAIYQRVHAAESAALQAERFRPSPISERLVAAGHLGRKMSGGFYRYDAAGHATGPDPEADLPEDPSHRLDEATIAERIVLAIVDEAYRALGDGVATADDIDLAMRLGAAHPVGPFERVEGFGGPAGVLAAIRRYGSDGPRFDPAPALLAAAHA